MTRRYCYYHQYQEVAESINDQVIEAIKHLTPIDIMGVKDIDLHNRTRTCYRPEGDLVEASFRADNSYYIAKPVYDIVKKLITPTMYHASGYPTSTDVLEVIRTLQFERDRSNKAANKHSRVKKELEPHPVSKFLAVKDKGCNGGELYFTADQFAMTMNGKWPRYNGNQKNANNYKQELSVKNKEAHNLILRAIQHGPNGLNNPLVCSFYNLNVEEYSTPEYPDIKFRSFDIHHILYKFGQSLSKNDKDPAEILKCSTVSALHKQEFMGCVILSKRAHAWIHGIATEGDLTFWEAHWNRGLGHRPYVLRGPAEFSEVCELLGITGYEWRDFMHDLYLENVKIAA